MPKHINLDRSNYFLIANDDTSNMPGSHWLAFYITKKNNERVIEFFDSYGFSPMRNKYFKRFISKFSDKLIYNKKMIQSPLSTYCGLYCIMFLNHKSMNKSLTSFVRQFDNDHHKNDKKIVKMYRNEFHRKKKNQTGGSCKLRKNRICIQTCEPLTKS